MKKRKIELLVPAKNLECGLAAIEHGADAVYIGAPQFGARVAANNSIDDISQLVRYAHLFGVKVYVTVNTILKNEELSATEEMIWTLYKVGVDALIIQDMGILELNLPPISLHSSTQNDNRTIQKIKFLEDIGFRQVVLARELSLNEIRVIHEASPNVLLEVFVHGALCVSYSGQCYVSEYRSGRSANRGACSQFCRLPFDLKDSNGATILSKKHLLSLKDLNQSRRLEDLIDAGASSLKIEGRLKDVSYVKNVTAAYRKELDRILVRRPEYIRASKGEEEFYFEPQLEKTFSRGFSNFFLDGRKDNIASFDTPKSLGEEMGYLKDNRGTYIIVAGVKPFHNGDGACYINRKGELKGFRINRVDGNKLYLIDPIDIDLKTPIYRNYDHEFEKLLSKDSAKRLLPINIELLDSDNGFTLKLSTDDFGSTVEVVEEFSKELARSDQKENIKKQLSKLGGTLFKALNIDVNLSNNWFIPSSLLSSMRREAVERLQKKVQEDYEIERQVFKPTTHLFPERQLTYLGNVMNQKANQFYARHGVDVLEPAFELKHKEDGVLMFCKHCIRYSMGWCPTYQHKKSPYKEPYFIVDPNGEEFQLVFDCKNCVMKVIHKS